MKDNNYEWPMPKGEQIIISRLREKIIAGEKARLQQEISMKRTRLKELCICCTESLKNNAPDPFIFYYQQYIGLVKKVGSDFGQKIENPYLIIAKYIRYNQVKNILKAVRDNGWLFDEEMSYGYLEQTDENRVTTYSYTNPAGYAIQWGNEFMLKALIALGINCRAYARKQGVYYHSFLGRTINKTSVEYNAFEYAIYDQRPVLVQIIYDSDPTIIDEGNPLKIALEVASKNKEQEKNEDPGRPSLFALVHDLVYKQKGTIDCSSFKITDIDYFDSEM